MFKDKLTIALSATALAAGKWLLRLLPGLTGDCYGAVCEVVETVAWLAAAPLALEPVARAVARPMSM